MIHEDDVIKWNHFPRYWPFMRGIHRSPVNSPHKGQWRGALMLSLICTWTNGWVNNRDAGDLRHHRAHCDVPVMSFLYSQVRNIPWRAIFRSRAVYAICFADVAAGWLWYTGMTSLAQYIHDVLKFSMTKVILFHHLNTASIHKLCTKFNTTKPASVSGPNGARPLASAVSRNIEMSH